MILVSDGQTDYLMSEEDAQRFASDHPEVGTGAFVGYFAPLVAASHYYCMECKAPHPMTSLSERLGHKLNGCFAADDPQKATAFELFAKDIVSMATAVVLPADKLYEILSQNDPLTRLGYAPPGTAG